MNAGIQYSKPLAVLCALAVCTASLPFLYYRRNAAERTLQIKVLESLARNGALQIAARSSFGDSNLASLRLRAAQSQALFAPGDTLDMVVGQLASSWSAESGPNLDRDGFRIQSRKLSMISPSLTDWPKVVDILGALERLPGVGITKFEMRTSGDSDHRNVDKLEIDVEIRSRSLSPVTVSP
jgi:hypothetical protein